MKIKSVRSCQTSNLHKELTKNSSTSNPINYLWVSRPILSILYFELFNTFCMLYFKGSFDAIFTWELILTFFVLLNSRTFSKVFCSNFIFLSRIKPRITVLFTSYLNPCFRHRPKRWQKSHSVHQYSQTNLHLKSPSLHPPWIFARGLNVWFAWTRQYVFSFGW